MPDSLKIFHISDIHFHEEDGPTQNYHRHSLPCMKAIQDVFEIEKPDILVVTGDLTNLGDRVSFDRVRQWLKDRINVSAVYYGLRAEKIPTIIVPGNHDAFNASTFGRNLQRWQSSLSNYTSAFPDAYLGEHGVDYFWFEDGSLKLFICAVDSCYLGEAEPTSRLGALSFSSIARGKFSKAQSRELVRLYDQGVRGELDDGRGGKILASAFLTSFKMMAIHHYLFDPIGAGKASTLQMSDRQVVFQNIAMADFDALICGHRHHADQQTVRYSDHFERRGRLRYAMNHVRRALGLQTLPLDESQTRGRALAHNLRMFLATLYRSYTPKSGMSPKVEQEILDCLEKCLDDPAKMKSELMDYVRKLKKGDTETGYFWEAEELLKLYNIIQKRFTRGQMRELSISARGLSSVIKKLASRPFLQVAAGSAAKASEVGTKKRSFNVYRITADPIREMHVFETTRYSWKQVSVTAGSEEGAFAAEVQPPVSMSYARLTKTDQSKEASLGG